MPPKRFGSQPSHGHWITRNETRQKHDMDHEANTTYAWECDATWKVLDQVLGTHLQVDFVVLSEGNWGDHDLQLKKYPNHLPQIQEALQKHDMKGIYWKHPVRKGDHQATYCEGFDGCVDSEAWITAAEKKRGHAFDNAHYKPYMYKAFALQLLDKIGSMTV